MLISKRKNFIYIHIPKTAGTSISNFLVDYADFKFKLVYKYYLSSKIIYLIDRYLHLSRLGQSYITGHHKHSKIIDVKDKMGEKMNDYSIFTFVRNPYEQMISLYHYIQKSKEHKYHNKAINSSFYDFVFFYINTNPPKQVDYILDKNGKINSMKIYKLESINESLVEISSTLNIEKPIEYLRKINQSGDRQRIPHEFFIQEELRKVFNEYFKDDFDILDYPTF